MAGKRPKPGKRERAARKRHRRTWKAFVGVWVSAPFTYWIHHHADDLASGLEPLKLGRKHWFRDFRRSLFVADSRNASKPKRCG
jgi:hypothetical protein